MNGIIKRTAALILFSFIAISAFLPCFAEKDKSDLNGGNWLSSIDGSALITSLNIPGTHDSAATFTTFLWISKTQKLTVAQQLEAGVRYLDMRFEMRNGDFFSVHSAADCKKSAGLFAEKLTAADTINECRRFLENHPSETVLFLLKEENSDCGESFFDAFYSQYIGENQDVWYLKNRTPSLDEVRGKIVLLRAVSVNEEKYDDSNSGINFLRYPYVGGTETIDFRLRDIYPVQNENAPYSHMFVQDSYKLAPSKKVDAVSAFWEEELDPACYNINMTNCIGGFVLPILTSKIVNSEISKAEFIKGEYYGIVGMDFITDDLCRQIYSSNAQNS